MCYPVLFAVVAALAGGLAVVAAAPTPARAEMGPFRNLAPAATATQSSTEWGGVATRAQDDDTNGAFFDNSVTHTASEFQPWWEADLGSVSSIGTIELWNRTDCCSERLAYFWVLVSDTPFVSTDLTTARNQPGVSSYYASALSGPSKTFDVNRTGRYVRVQLAGHGALSLAEVKIFSTQALPAVDAQGWVTNNPFGMFIHYGPGTFTDNQWSDPNTPASVFNPSNLDADQWARGIRSAGMTFGVLTAKHHDGFALFPTDHSTYDVSSSPYQGGSGDVVREYVDALRAHGLKVGLYFSIWDRHNGQTTELVKNQLRELLTRYGRIDYLWFDGWGWAMGGGTQYDEIPYQPVRDFIRDVSPKTVVANNDHRRSTDTTDVLIWEVPIDGLPPNTPTPKDASDTLDTNSTWFYSTGTFPGQPTTGAPKSAASIESNLTGVNQGNALYLLNVGPDWTGQITQPYMDRLAEIGRNSISQSSTAWGGDALRASDGNTDGDFWHGSVSHTDYQQHAWWRRDLRRSKRIDTLRIWNRTIEHADRLSDYWVFISDQPFDTSLTPTQQSAQPGVWSRHLTTTAGRPTTLSPGANGRYVMIQLAGTNYLSLAEVQINP